mmetsp:Transcript_4471/g.5323  ORF Transcript_4471/g.5323 Transcript_4471/m.5323 type:complete len:91 (+) Transcript_4471:213-485(+)
MAQSLRAAPSRFQKPIEAEKKLVQKQHGKMVGERAVRSVRSAQGPDVVLAEGALHGLLVPGKEHPAKAEEDGGVAAAVAAADEVHNMLCL